MQRFALIKDGFVENIFTAEPEWAQEVYGDAAVPAPDDLHPGHGFNPVDRTFFIPPRNVEADAALIRAEILRQIAQTVWTTDPDNSLTGPEKAAWAAWRRGLRTALRSLTVEELADYVIPTPPGPLNEA